MSVPTGSLTVGNVDPVYLHPFPFHASEPCHLSFCELMDGNGEQVAHLFIREHACQVQCDEFVFQSVVYQIFCRQPGGEQTPHFVYQTVFKSRVEPPVYAAVAFLAAHECAYEKGLLWKA